MVRRKNHEGYYNFDDTTLNEHVAELHEDELTDSPGIMTDSDSAFNKGSESKSSMNHILGE